LQLKKTESLPFFASWKLNSETVTYFGPKRETKYFIGVNDHSFPFSGTNTPEFEPPAPCNVDKYRIEFTRM
jgi:hypothetical protein